MTGAGESTRARQGTLVMITVRRWPAIAGLRAHSCSIQLVCNFLSYANCLFNPQRVFEGSWGFAYGGPDLSDRNLRLLSLLRQGQSRGEICREPLETSATGDVSSGRIAVEYALLGCTSLSNSYAFPASGRDLRNAPGIQDPACHTPALLRPCRWIHPLGDSCFPALGVDL